MGFARTRRILIVSMRFFMTAQVLTSADQMTPEWLTYVLAKSRALTHGAVQAIEFNTNERELSTSYRLRIAYSDDAQGLMPEFLFLKTVNADMDEEFFWIDPKSIIIVRITLGWPARRFSAVMTAFFSGGTAPLSLAAG